MKIIKISIVVILLVFTLSACTPTQDDTMTVGAILGLTGVGSFYSYDIMDGMFLAQKDLAKEGIDINLVFEDSKTDPKEAVTAFNKLKDIDNPDLIISIFSVTSVPLVPLANENEIPLLVTLTSAKDIGKNPYVLQYYLKSEDYAYPIAQTLDEEGYDKVAILHSQEDFGNSVKDAFVEKFSELNGQIEIIESFTMPTTDFKTNLLKIKNSDAEAIVFAGYKLHYINAVNDIAELGLDLPLFEMSPNTMYPSVIEELGAYAEGNIAISLDFPVKGDKIFEDKFEMAYKRKPNIASSLGYDMVMLAGKATQGRALEGNEIVDRLISLGEFNGLNGNSKINSYGEFKFPISIVEVNEGKLVNK